MAPLWQQLGLVPVAKPAEELGYWQPLDVFLHPYALARTLENMFLRLPAFLRHWAGKQAQQLLAMAGLSAAGSSQAGSKAATDKAE